MQFIAIIAAVFATSAFAAVGGNEEGPYYDDCTCTNSMGYEDVNLGKKACDNLQDTYVTLHWTGSACIDNAKQGIEANGYRRACQAAGGWDAGAVCYYD